MLPLLTRLAGNLLLTKNLPPRVAKQVLHSLQTKQPSALLRLVKIEGAKSSWKSRPAFTTKVDYIINWKEYLREGIKKARKKPSLIEQWRRINTRSNWKNAFKTLGWDYIKRQIWSAKNQSQLFSRGIQTTQIIEPVSTARDIEKSIIRRLVTNQKGVIDRAMFSSSAIYSGTWVASSSQQNYWEGTMTYTFKVEKPKGVFYKLGKTYTVHMFPLAVWSLMKAALGREGTGAYSVYLNSYLKGMRSGKQIAASKWSSQVF